MGNFMTKDYWDERYANLELRLPEKAKTPKKLWKRVMVKLMGQWLREYNRSYLDYLVWDVIFRKYLPNGQGLKAIEIGSAPGLFAVRLMRDFGYVPYGVEYSSQGVEVNKRVFAANGIAEDNVIHADIFSPEFRDAHRESFDVVFSWSFIEHFSEAVEPVKVHLELLKPGGTMVVVIPNHKGFNGWLLKIMNRELLEKHNVGIMDKAVFRGLFDLPGLSPLYCNHIGTFSLCLWNPSRAFVLRRLVNFLKRLDPCMGCFLRLIYGSKGFETKLSPWIVFIGKKQGADSAQES